MTERCPKCGSKQIGKTCYGVQFACWSIQPCDSVVLDQDPECELLEAAYNRGREDERKQPSLPSDEEAECLLHNLGYSIEGGAGELLHWLRTKAQGAE